MFLPLVAYALLVVVLRSGILSKEDAHAQETRHGTLLLILANVQVVKHGMIRLIQRILLVLVPQVLLLTSSGMQRQDHANASMEKSDQIAVYLLHKLI